MHIEYNEPAYIVFEEVVHYFPVGDTHFIKKGDNPG